MSRYFSRPKKGPRANYIGDAEPLFHGMLPDISVSDHRPTFTGLVDKRGDPIWRAPNPMGFGRR